MSGILKKWLYAFLLLATFLVLLVGFFPLLVEEFVLPPVLAKVGLADYKFSISRLGLNGCSLHIAGRPNFSSPVVAGNIRIDWTPSGLLQRRIEKISSNSLQVNLVGLPTREVPVPVEPGYEEKSDHRSSLPVIVEQIVINNGAFFFQAGKQVVYLPFTFSGHRTGDFDFSDPAGVIQFQTRTQVAENVVNATVTIYPSQGKISGKLDSSFDLASLGLIIPSFQSATLHQLNGNAQLKIDAAAQIAPFALGALEATLVLDNLQISGNSFSIFNQKAQPARVELFGSGDKFKVVSTGLHVMRPFQTSLDFDADISLPVKNLEWTGLIELAPEPGVFLHDTIMLKDVQPIRISHSGSRSEGKNSVHLTSDQPEDGVDGSSFILQQNDIVAAIKGFDIDANITYDQRSEFITLTGTLLLNGHNVTVESPDGFVKVPKISLQAEGTVPFGQDGSGFSARLNVEDVSLGMEKQGLEVQGLNLELPFVWPPAVHAEKGILQVAKFRKGGKELGRFEAGVVQNVEALSFNGFLQTPLLPEDKINLTGTVRLPKQKGSFADLAFSLQKSSLDVNNFIPIIPELQGAVGTGNADVQGNLAISSCGLSGQTDFAFTNGQFILPDGETEFEDIDFRLQFPSLPLLNTLPMQQLSIGTIRKKKLLVNDVKVLFEVESPGSLFIEKISGRWSEGRVFTSSFRLQKGQDKFDLAIFCDRLELSSILSQFSLAEAGGEGRMSGRVPIAYAKGKFFIDDGFLFSSPGEKGYLKIKKSNYLETTIPADVPHFSPLHFAGAAMADFEYNWAKLQIKSEEENLLLKLQVDGKPREKLPFRFDATNNVFVRLDDDSKGGIDQPIKLDVNFNVPVNEMFYYKDKLMPLFQKFN